MGAGVCFIVTTGGFEALRVLGCCVGNEAGLGEGLTTLLLLLCLSSVGLGLVFCCLLTSPSALRA